VGAVINPAMQRHERIRIQNVRIAASALRHHFDGTTGIPFLCECDDELCHEFVVLPLLTFDRVRRDRDVLVADGHDVTGAEHAAPADGYTLVRLTASSAA
jgi:hypothetical protein